MRAVREETLTVPSAPDAAFEAALGVVQGTKSAQILAVHTGGRKLIVREKAKLSNPKFQFIWVEGQGQEAQLHVAVGTDPRTPKALMDGKANERTLKKFVESVRGALDGSAPAPATPVANHYVQKKTEIPWEDPNQAPDIELGGNFGAMYGM